MSNHLRNIREERHSVPAVVALGNRRRECVVTSLSDQGALLRLRADGLLPSAFTLVIGEQGVRRAARLLWLRGREAGVSFSQSCP
jgi:hypothetical protein